MDNPQANNTGRLRGQQRLALVLLCAAIIGGVAFIAPRPSLAEREPAPPSPAQQTRGASKRLFIHDKNHIRSGRDAKGRLTSNCDECHRIPGSFYLADKPQGYNVREFPDHPDCLRCHEHRKDFFKGGNPPICTVCHKSSTPREGDPGLFPKASGPDVEKDFTGRFPHDIHQDILAHNQPVTGPSAATFVKAGFQPQDPKPKPTPTSVRWDCARCHEPYPAEIEKQMLTNIDWEAFQKTNNLKLFEGDLKKLYTDAKLTIPLLDSTNNLPNGILSKEKTPEKDPTTPQGVFRQSPNGPTAHQACFECHAQTKEAWNSPYPRAGDCAGCHGLGRALEPPSRPNTDGTIAKTIMPLALTPAGRQAVNEVAAREGFLEVPRLMPRISYKFQHDINDHRVVECTVCHVGIVKKEIITSANPDVPMASCAICHTASGGKVIKIKGIPAGLKLDDELKNRRADPQYNCIGCHTPDTGRNPPPDSHYDAVGKKRF